MLIAHPELSVTSLKNALPFRLGALVTFPTAVWLVDSSLR